MITRPALFALILASASLPAAAVGGTDAARPKTVALVSTSSVRGDDSIRELFESALGASGQLAVVARADGADFVGRIDIVRSESGTTLTLVVLSRNGSILLRTHRTVPPGGSLVNAAEGIARQVIAASRGEALPADVDAAGDDAPLEEARPVRTHGRQVTNADRRPEADERGSPEKRFEVVVGLELGGGPWLADPTALTNASKNNFDLSQYSVAFTNTINDQWRGDLNLHAGFKFLGFGALEAAVQSSLWGSTAPTQGGAVLAGVRITGYPLEVFLPDRKFDLGVEIGGGYALLGASSYDMEGTYFTVGLTGEYRVTPWISVGIFYRLFTPFLTKFDVDYKNGISEKVQGFTAYWNTLGASATFHVPLAL